MLRRPAAIVVAVLLCACTGSAHAPRTAEQPPQRGGATAAGTASSARGAGGVRSATSAPAAQQTLTFNLGAEPFTLDPAKTVAAQDVELERLLWRGLFTLDPNGRPVPALAARLPTVANGDISADGLTYTIALRPGQRFSNGAPLTATDVAYAILRLLDPQTAAGYAGFYADIVGAEAYTTALGTSDHPRTPSTAALQSLRDAVGVHALTNATLQFTLTAPSTSFLIRLALWPTYPLEQAALVAAGDRPLDVGTLVGNGPYVLQEHVPYDHLTLVANPNFSLSPQPVLQRLTFRIVADPVQALTAYRTGELDAVTVPPPLVQQVVTDGTLTGEVYREPVQSSWGLEFNLTRPPFDNLNVRRAFARSVDREALVHVALGNAGQPGATWLPPGLAGYDPAHEQILAYDVAAAQQAPAAAGFPGGRGFPSITLLLTAPQAQVFEFLQHQWQDHLHVTVNAEVVDGQTLAVRRQNLQYQLVIGGWLGDYPDAEDWLPALWGTAARANTIGYASGPFDATMVAARGEADPQKRAGLWAAGEQILLQDAAVAVLWHGDRVSLWKPRVKGQQAGLMDVIAYGDNAFESLYIAR
jgi:oligopeptide transport system substrate-binding protein